MVLNPIRESNLSIMKMDVVSKWYFRVKCEQVVHVYSQHILWIYWANFILSVLSHPWQLAPFDIWWGLRSLDILIWLVTFFLQWGGFWPQCCWTKISSFKAQISTWRFVIVYPLPPCHHHHHHQHHSLLSFYSYPVILHRGGAGCTRHWQLLPSLKQECPFP